jgi:hypothetical protein
MATAAVELQLNACKQSLCCVLVPVPVPVPVPDSAPGLRLLMGRAWPRRWSMTPLDDAWQGSSVQMGCLEGHGSSELVQVCRGWALAWGWSYGWGTDLGLRGKAWLDVVLWT